MAIVLKADNFIIGPYGSKQYDVYGAIDRLSLYDKRKMVAEFTLDLYTSKEAREQGFKPFQRVYFSVEGEKFQNILGGQIPEDVATSLYLYVMENPITQDGKMTFDPSLFKSDE